MSFDIKNFAAIFNAVNFEELYHTHKKLVFNLALQYVQNTEDAQEISQDVFVSIHQNLSSFENRSKLSTWIYRITINKSLDFIKAKKRKKRFGFFSSLFHEESGEIIHESASFDHPGILMEHKEAFETLFKFINELPINQRTALILSKIEQKPQSEVAEIMDLSVKAVESLIQRAKTNLAQKIKNNEGK